MKTFIRVGIPAIVVAVAGAVGIGFLLAGPHKQLRYRTQAALLRAVPVTATAELRHRGVPLTTPLTCRSMPGATKRRMRVACSGLAQGRRAVHVVAAGQASTQDQYFTILVAGRPLVQNVDCLGADCRKK